MWIGSVLLGGLLGTAAPAGAQRPWNQAYGDPANTSYMDIFTSLPVAASWAYALDGPVLWGGPAVGADGLIYVGIAAGTLWGFLPDGNVHCRHTFAGSTIASTPAIFPNGDVAVLVTRPAEDAHQTALARLTPGCGLVWQVDLPRTPYRPSRASGSVKIWTLETTSFLFVHGFFTIDVDTLDGQPDSHHELLVFDEDGALFARRQTGNFCYPIRGGGGTEAADLIEALGDLWDYVANYGVGPAPPYTPLYKIYGWPDSTPAIMDSDIRGVSTPTRPMVAVTDHNCAVSLDVFQFIPGAPSFTDRLVKRWGTRVESEATLLSSPSVTREGLIAFGTSGNRVRVYGAHSRSLLWSYDTKLPVMHPPALTPGPWIVTAEGWIHFLSPAGDLLPTARPQPFPTLGATSLAASASEVVVPHAEELGIFTHDLTGITHALQIWRFVTSSPALTPEGRLYVVAQNDGGRSVLIAFGR